jgi:hypothetical protein
MSRACVCGGSNENCRYCYGLGTIPERTGNPVVAYTPGGGGWGRKRRSGRRRPKKSLSSTPFTQVPRPKHFEASRSPDEVKTPLQGTRGDGVGALPKTQSGSDNSNAVPQLAPVYGICPVCKAKVKLTTWFRHISKPHSHLAAFRVWEAEGVRPPAKGSLQDGANLGSTQKKKLDSRPVFVQCPICKVTVKAAKLSRHIIKAHRRVPIGAGVNSVRGKLRTASSASGATTAAYSDESSRGRKTTFIAPRDKNLDVTKPYAHAYRETGRYGSHPSHDGFDDESGPE